MFQRRMEETGVTMQRGRYSDSEDYCGEDKHDETKRCGHVQRPCTETTERDDERLPPWSTVVVRHGKKGRTRVVGCFFEEGGRSGRKKA